MDNDLTIDEARKMFILKPHTIYSLSSPSFPTVYFQVIGYEIESDVPETRTVDLKFSHTENVVSVEEDYFFEFVENKGFVICEVKEII